MHGDVWSNGKSVSPSLSRREQDWEPPKYLGKQIDCIVTILTVSTQELQNSLNLLLKDECVPTDVLIIL